MARITTRRPDEDEEELLEDDVDSEEEADDESVAPSAPAVSDSRRRRMMKRGEAPAAQESESAVAASTRKDRPTPSQRAEPAKSSNFLVRTVQDLDTYRRETWDELKKVTWLSREENTRLTYIVLVVTAVSAASLGLVSFLFGLLTQALAGTSSGFAAGIVVIVLIIGVSGGWLLRDRLFPTRFD